MSDGSHIGTETSEYSTAAVVDGASSGSYTRSYHDEGSLADVVLYMPGTARASRIARPKIFNRADC